jgi:hypothetical protein
MTKAPALLLFGTALLCGCETWDVDKYDVKIVHKYPLPPEANQECKDATAKARHWCRDVAIPTDNTWAEQCRAAQWTYDKWCR